KLLLTVDVVLVLKREKQSVPEIGFEWIAGRCRRPMLVLANSNYCAEKSLKRADSRVLDQVLRRRDRQSRTADHIDVSACPLADLRIAARDKYMAVVQLEQQRIPADIFSDDSVGHIAFISARYIVDNVDDRRLARLCRASKDIQRAGPKREL